MLEDVEHIKRFSFPLYFPISPFPHFSFSFFPLFSFSSFPLFPFSLFPLFPFFSFPLFLFPLSPSSLLCFFSSPTLFCVGLTHFILCILVVLLLQGFTIFGRKFSETQLMLLIGMAFKKKVRYVNRERRLRGRELDRERLGSK